MTQSLSLLTARLIDLQVLISEIVVPIVKVSVRIWTSCIRVPAKGDMFCETPWSTLYTMISETFVISVTYSLSGTMMCLLLRSAMILKELIEVMPVTVH